MKTKQTVIIVIAIIIAICVWAAAIISLNDAEIPSSATMPNSDNATLVSPEEFGGMDVSMDDIPVTGSTVVGVLDGLFGTNFVDELGGEE